MYLSHYQLDRAPFTISADPDFLWLGPKHAAVLEALIEGVFNREGCLLLTGDIGTGKTSLVRRLAQMRSLATIFVTIHDPTLSPLDFYNNLSIECGLNQHYDGREMFYEGFKHFLAERFSAHKKLLMVIDEAQHLPGPILKEAVEISKLEIAGCKPLKVIFVGSLDFAQALKREENRGVLQNLISPYCLEPLTEEETALYVRHRLSAAGRPTALFTAAGLQAVHAISRGYPRLINILCDHALLHGYGSNLQEIDAQAVRECSQDLEMSLDGEHQTDTPPVAPFIVKADDPSTRRSRIQPPQSGALSFTWAWLWRWVQRLSS